MCGCEAYQSINVVPTLCHTFILWANENSATDVKGISSDNAKDYQGMPKKSEKAIVLINWPAYNNEFNGLDERTKHALDEESQDVFKEAILP